MGRMLAGLLLLLCSALVVIFVPTCQAADYAFRVDHIYTTGRCYKYAPSPKRSRVLVALYEEEIDPSSRL